jgi:transcriptional regulator with XRE-family HTH domain
MLEYSCLNKRGEIMFLYKKIKEARIEKKMTQKQLAEELTKKGRKTSNTAIANWEAGLNSPDVDTVQLICQILEKDGNYFFDTPNDFRYATQSGISTDGLDKDEIEEINRFVEFIRNKKKQKK